MRVVVTGGRNYLDRATLFEVLDYAHSLVPITDLAHGKARGADTLAGEWFATRFERRAIEYPAQWARDGRKRAGPIRNRRMLDDFKPQLVIAFPGGTGTDDCVTAARERRIVVLDLRALLPAQ